LAPKVPDLRRVAEGPPRRIRYLLMWHPTVSLLFFLQFEIRPQLALQLSISFPDLPPSISPESISIPKT
jgi:hypothetical protein